MKKLAEKTILSAKAGAVEGVIKSQDLGLAPGGKVTTQHKDMQQAIELAASHGLELPASKLNMALYQKLIDHGDGNLDHSALIKALENYPE